MKAVALVLAVAFGCAAAPPNDKTLGGSAAPVQVEIFSSFDCSACKQLHEEFLPLLVQNYVVSGKVFVVQHEAPLEGHALARKAAEYATAAARIGKYWAVTDALFRRQAEWEGRGDVWTAVSAVLSAEEAQRVQSLVKDPAVAAEVERDSARKFQYIPTIVVTSGAKSHPLNGMPDFGLFRRLVDSLLIRR